MLRIRQVEKLHHYQGWFEPIKIQSCQYVKIVAFGVNDQYVHTINISLDKQIIQGSATGGDLFDRIIIFSQTNLFHAFNKRIALQSRKPRQPQSIFIQLRSWYKQGGLRLLIIGYENIGELKAIISRVIFDQLLIDKRLGLDEQAMPRKFGDQWPNRVRPDTIIGTHLKDKNIALPTRIQISRQVAKDIDFRKPMLIRLGFLYRVSQTAQAALSG